MSQEARSAASSCDQPMRGIYGAETICARPAGHTGKHDPIWNQKDWPRASSAAQGHRTLLRLGPLFVFADDGYEPGERVLFVTFRLPRLSRV